MSRDSNVPKHVKEFLLIINKNKKKKNSFFLKKGRELNKKFREFRREYFEIFIKLIFNLMLNESLLTAKSCFCMILTF